MAEPAVLIRNAGPLWEEATRSPFLDAAAAGALPAEAFERWLSAAQEYFNAVLAHERDFWKMLWEG